MKIHNYSQFIRESNDLSSHYLPNYEDCLEMCSKEDAAFYESKFVIDGYNISVFNYRLAQYKDFITPLENKPDVKAYEMRGLTFVFNEDGTLFRRFLLLEKFFNLNQVPESMYSIVKDYKIKFINNKEDGSIASFIKLPNGKVLGKSKMGFDNEQANGINRIYRTRTDVKKFVDWCLQNEITSIFEFVSPANRIVLRYLDEDLILLRMRDNTTGKHLDIKNYLDKIGTIRIAPFEDDNKDLDSLIEVIAKEVDKEGVIVQAEDKWGKDFFFKLKTPWYMERHGLLTNDIYREHIIIGYILDDKIDDILGQIPEDEKEAHNRINKIIQIVKKSINDKSVEIERAYKDYIKSGISRKDYAINQRKSNLNFAFVMEMVKADDMRRMSKEQIIDHYDSMEAYEKSLKRCEPYEMAKEWLRDLTKRLAISREWLKTKDKTLFFQDPDTENEDN
jgi:T4 RnlA family RNA ligase